MIKDFSKTNEDTVVGENVRVTGKLHTSSNIQINGHVKGEISSEGTVIVGEKATVEGPISASNIRVEGIIKGSLVCFNELELESSAKLFGDIQTKNLSIKAGAVFNGKSIMKEEKELKKESGKEERKTNEAKSREAEGEMGKEEIQLEKKEIEPDVEIE